jgi:hypothetical protein
MSRMIELPESLYLRLRREAEANGKTLVGWLDAILKEQEPENIADEDNAEANARLHTVSLDHAVGADNEGIDDTLVREYGDDHAELYRTFDSSDK